MTPRPNSAKIALVTGASSGMGKEIAKTLMSQGMTVYVAVRSVDKMAKLAKLGAIPLRMDIPSNDEITAAVATILSGHGGIDVLVNNAGYGLYGPVDDIALDRARYQFATGLRARLLTLDPAPGIRARAQRSDTGTGTVA